MTAFPHVIVDRPDIHANFDALVQIEPWRYVGVSGQPAFENSWVNYDATRTARFYKDALGIVHPDGYIKDGTLGLSAWTFPVGYRPGRNIDVPCVSNGGLPGMVLIGANGTVVPTTGATSDFSLSGISFRAEA